MLNINMKRKVEIAPPEGNTGTKKRQHQDGEAIFPSKRRHVEETVPQVDLELQAADTCQLSKEEIVRLKWRPTRPTDDPLQSDEPAAHNDADTDGWKDAQYANNSIMKPATLKAFQNEEAERQKLRRGP